MTGKKLGLVLVSWPAIYRTKPSGALVFFFGLLRYRSVSRSIISVEFAVSALRVFLLTLGERASSSSNTAVSGLFVSSFLQHID